MTDTILAPPEPLTADGRLVKAPTGIVGLDELTYGGLPAGRPTLVCGSAGCGKTLLAMEFLVRGAVEYGEPGVFLAFEEPSADLVVNFRSLGFDLDEMTERKQIVLDSVQIDRSEIEESGEYDLEGLFLRLGWAIDSIGAKRVVLDTLETLFSGFTNQAILRAELRRLFHWLKERGVTAVITAERGDGSLTRQGLEEYVSDCVILLDHRVIDQVATRRLRVVKYRGSAHGTNEYPFLIDSGGFEVLPITAAGLSHTVSRERVSSGVPKIDELLGGDGYYRGSSVLISGTAGSGKSSLAAHFAAAACRRGERCLYFAFEESQDQVVRNMQSIGVDLSPFLRDGSLVFQAARPSVYGLEGHLALMHRLVRQVDPHVVIVDPISTFLSVSAALDVKSLLVRLLDFLKARRVTGVFTSLTSGGGALEQTDVAVSSLIDTWLLLRDFESGGERNRGLHILKSRGMAHSNQVHEFRLTPQGIEVLEVALGDEGVLVGSQRHARLEQIRLAEEQQAREIAGRRRELDLKRQAMEARVAALRSEFAMEEELLDRLLSDEELARDKRDESRMGLARDRNRHGDSASGSPQV